MREYPAIPVSEIHRAGGLAAWLSQEARKPSKPPSMPESVLAQPDPKPARKTGIRVSEHEEQKALLTHCRAMQGRYPDLATLYSVPNGGARHPAVAAKLKAEGVKAGMPDLCLPVPRGGFLGLYVEMKAEGGTISEGQYRAMQDLSAAGHRCIACWGWAEAWREIEEYLQLKHQGTRVAV